MGIYLHFVRIMWQMKPCSFRLVIPFLLALSLSVSLFFHLGFHRKCPAEQTNKKIRSKTTQKITDFTFSYQPPLMSFFQSSSLFPQYCFVFAFFVFFCERKQ